MPVRAVQIDFLGDPNIGLFTKASDKLLMAGPQMPDKAVQKAADTLKVEVLRTGLANSELTGIFCAMNSNGILLPKIATESEFDKIRTFAKGAGMSVLTVGSDFTAIGNLILCNDKGAVTSSLLTKKEMGLISDCLGVECAASKVAGMDNVGSCGIATNEGCLLHRDSTEEELDFIQEVLKVDTDIGTANFGSPFVGGCAVANSKGLVAGASTTGPEISRMMESLKLI